MQTKLIQTKDYLLLIDEEAEIKEGYDCILSKDENVIFQIGAFVGGLADGGNKIIAYYPLTKGAKELDLPLLPDPFEEVDIEKLAEKEIPYNPHDSTLYQGYRKYELKGFINGYKAAQSKGQYSLEDIEKAILRGMAIYAESVSGMYSNSSLTRTNLKDEYIKSLATQQLPKEFIPEYEERGTTKFWTAFYSQNEKGIDNPDDFEWNIMKTITNSKGQKVVQGDYKF